MPKLKINHGRFRLETEISVEDMDLIICYVNDFSPDGYRKALNSGLSIKKYQTPLSQLNIPKWNDWIHVLEEYSLREGHSVVPAEHVEKGLSLGNWVQNLRQRYKANTLSKERILQLENMQGWKWKFTNDDRKSRTWNKWLRLLGKYVDREGHAKVPALHREDGTTLGAWVASQRCKHRKGKLSDEHTKELETFKGWSWGR